MENERRVKCCSAFRIAGLSLGGKSGGRQDFLECVAESKIRGWLDSYPSQKGTSSHEMLKGYEMQLRMILIIVVRNMLLLSSSLVLCFKIRRERNTWPMCGLVDSVKRTPPQPIFFTG